MNDLNHSKIGNFIEYYWNELAPKSRKSKISDDENFILCHPTCELAKWIAEDFDEAIALELGKVLISLYDR